MKTHPPDYVHLQRRRRKRRADEAPPDQLPQGYAAGLAGPDHPTAQAQRQEAVRELQASHGNAHVQRLIARAAADKQGTTAEAVKPQFWDGDHGLYQVYPDEYPLGLKLVQDPKREWPLPQKIAERLRPISARLKGGATDIVLKGGVAFKLALLMDLAWLNERPAGRDLLDALLRARHRLTFEYAPEGGEPQAVSPPNAELRPDGAFGSGSDVLLRYAPDPWTPSSGFKGMEQRKPAEGLARSLVAVLPLLTGTAPSTREREPVVAGTQATGDDRIKQMLILENRLRGAFGLPLRPDQ